MGGMKSFFKKIDYLFDYYVAYLLYSPRKSARYNEYMKRKWKK